MPWLIRVAHPTDSVASSLFVVEYFMGARLSPELATAVRHLPPEQARVLQEMLHEYEQTGRGHLIGRMPGRHPEITFESLTRSDKRTLHRVLEEDLTIHERSYDPDRSTRLDNIGMLKYLALYCEHTVINDPVSARPAWAPVEAEDWTPEHCKRWCDELAAQLFELLPVAGLVRSGAFVLLPPGSGSWTDSNLVAAAPFDSYVRWIIEHEQPHLVRVLGEASDRYYDTPADDPDGKARAQSALAEVLTMVKAALVDHYRRAPYGLGTRQTMDLLRMVEFVPGFTCAVATSSPAIANHLKQSARIELDRKPAPAAFSTPLRRVEAASTYGIPSLQAVSFADITRLRKNEEVFAKLRTALVRLDDACAADGPPSSYREYEQTIRRNAPGILADAYDDLRRWQRQATWGRWGGLVLGASVDLAIDGVATALTGGLPTPAGDLAGAAVARATGRNARRMYEDTELALGILKTIAPK